MGCISHKRQMSHGSYTIALICPHELVLSAVRFMLDEEHKRLPKEKNDPLYYVLGSMSGHNVVLASLPGGVPGDVSTATIATHLIHTFPAAELRLMVNISGGVPNTSEDIQLGDVVVSDPDPQRSGVVTYDFGKVTKYGFQRRVRHMPPTPAPLVGACVSMRHDHRSNPRPIPDTLSAISRKHRGMKAFSRPTSQNEFPPQSNVHYGIIASGARVVRDSKQRDELAAKFGAICLDTAASGLEYYPGLVVCGIYHYCDSDYNDAWAGYAAAAAAACVRNMLSFIPPVVRY